jgi:hypothetical protein
MGPSRFSVHGRFARLKNSTASSCVGCFGSISFNGLAARQFPPFLVTPHAVSYDGEGMAERSSKAQEDHGKG